MWSGRNGLRMNAAADTDDIPVTVNVERSGPCRKVLHIEVPSTVVALEYRKVVDSFAKAARIPGFRAGRAPAHLVERHFGKEILEETKDHLMPQAYQTALSRERISAVAVVEVNSIQVSRGEPLKFDVSVDVEPEFALPAYRGIPLQRLKLEIDEAQVDAAIARMRERSARFEEAGDRPAHSGDLVQIDYAATLDGRPLKELAAGHAELGEGRDFWVLLGDQELIPGLGAKLAAAVKGEHRDIEIAFPQEFPVAELAGKTATYAVDVKAVRERKLPELDAEFLKTMGVETEPDLRQRVRASLAESAALMETDRLKDEAIRWLLGNVQIRELPKAIVEDEARRIIRDIVTENTRRGATKSEIEQRRDDIFEHAARSSEERIKIQYILRRIADEEKLTVSEEEVDREVDLMARRHNVPKERVRAALEKRDALDGVRRNLLAEKALEGVLKSAAITEVAPRPPAEQGATT